ncbi:MAG: sigma-54-dependent Fis family transcriptional regulator [Magnetococcales bacterium]|nr:sigma-54-dependent Fis family transcriptional regulator [Magnetococcales bacterium]
MKKNQPSQALPIVLVDDEEEALIGSSQLLQEAGLGLVVTLTESRELLAFLSKNGAAVVVLDMVKPFVQGQTLLQEVRARFPEMPVIVTTAMQELQTAVTCMKMGAFDCLGKPIEKNRFITTIKRAVELQQLRLQTQTLKEYLLSGQLQNGDSFATMVTRSERMRAIFQYVEAVAPSMESVLVSGETGVGKELLVGALHQVSGRAGSLVALNVAGIDDHFFSDTLFGHRKGAFSGADRVRQGLIAEAAGGTLFLDEIGELAETSQVKLLRLLQDQAYYPLGSDVPHKSDARVVCATHRDLKAAVKAGHFRSDLYYRLATHQIHIPPLRERQEDISLLVDHFLKEAAHTLHKQVPTPPPELFQLLNVHPFPGNIRELMAMVHDAVARHRSGILSMKSFVDKLVENPSPVLVSERQESQEENLFQHLPNPLPTFREAEEQLLEEAMRRAGNNQGIAANMLGLSRPALNRRVRLASDKERGGKS